MTNSQYLIVIGWLSLIRHDTASGGNTIFWWFGMIALVVGVVVALSEKP